MPNAPSSYTRPIARPLVLAAAFCTGGLLTLMVLLNGRLATLDGGLFASWVAHGTGTLAATFFLLLLPGATASFASKAARPPLWAYAGGISGAVTVILTSITLNSALALSGTLALGLLGQVAFGLAADRWGLLGMPRRRPSARDFVALGLILAGSLLIIFSDKLAPLSPVTSVTPGPGA